MQQQTISIGGREFALRPLTLGQLRYVLDALDEMAGKSGGALIEAAARLVAAGLASANLDVTMDTVLGLEASVEDLNTAVAVILNLAGLKPQGAAPETEMGEASSPDGGTLRITDPGMTMPGPEPLSAPSSPAFTAPSPPAAGIPSPPSMP